jgi:hypothetical protein
MDVPDAVPLPLAMQGAMTVPVEVQLEEIELPGPTTSGWYTPIRSPV